MTNPPDKCPECGLEDIGDSRDESWQVYYPSSSRALYAEFGPCKRCGWTEDRGKLNALLDRIKAIATVTDEADSLPRGEPETYHSLSGYQAGRGDLARELLGLDPGTSVKTTFAIDAARQGGVAIDAEMSLNVKDAEALGIPQRIDPKDTTKLD